MKVLQAVFVEGPEVDGRQPLKDIQRAGCFDLSATPISEFGRKIQTFRLMRSLVHGHIIFMRISNC